MLQKILKNQKLLKNSYKLKVILMKLKKPKKTRKMHAFILTMYASRL